MPKVSPSSKSDLGSYLWQVELAKLLIELTGLVKDCREKIQEDNKRAKDR